MGENRPAYAEMLILVASQQSLTARTHYYVHVGYCIIWSRHSVVRAMV